MKIGLLFAGQGAQYPGMGKSLYDHSKGARKIFEQAGDEIRNWCFEGTKEMLRQTSITQPCIYTVSMAAYEALSEEIAGMDTKAADSIELQAMAGFSLGEYTALTAAGVIKDFETGLSIVKQRGRWMHEAGLDANGENRGGMVAAFGKRTDILNCLEMAREDGILTGANFNSATQTVVAGDVAALSRFIERAKAAGHMKVVPLSVSTAFHSAMMEPAAGKLLELLLASGFREPKSCVYSNVTGRDIVEGASQDHGQWIAKMMADQVRSPVYWQETIENMQADGIDAFIEIGPGKTLSGIVRKINPASHVMNVEDCDSLAKTVEVLKSC